MDNNDVQDGFVSNERLGEVSNTLTSVEANDEVLNILPSTEVRDILPSNEVLKDNHQENPEV